MTHDERRRVIPLAMRAALASVGDGAVPARAEGRSPRGTPARSRCWARSPTPGSTCSPASSRCTACKLAAEPADHDHRFGHGKAEALAALFQVGADHRVGGRRSAGARSCAFGEPTRRRRMPSSASACRSSRSPRPPCCSAYQRRIIRQTGSVAILADNVHYQSDVLLNGSVIAALVLDQYLGWRGADPVFGIAIALWLAWGAFQASSNAIDQLMDKEWPEDAARRLPRGRRAPARAEAASTISARAASGTPRFRAVPHGGRRAT